MSIQPWTGEIVAERLANAASTLARSRSAGASPTGLRSAWPSIAPTEEDRRLAYGYNAAAAPRILPAAAELSAMDQVLQWVTRYLTHDACRVASLPTDAGWVAWERAKGVSLPRIGEARARRWGTKPAGGNSREALRVISNKACDLVAGGLNRDQVPIHVGAVDAPPEAAPILSGRREALPRHIDNRRYLTNRLPCATCQHMQTLDDGRTWCGTRGGAVAPSQRAQHPEGEPCFEQKVA